MQTVLIANRKGGVGKTMTVVTIASALAQAGHRVAIADADAQQSALGWLARRPATVPPIRGVSWVKSGDIGDHPKKLDWLLIDAPGALKDSRAEALIAEARAVIAPVQPGVFDQASTEGFIADIEELKRIRKGKVVVHLVANRLRAGSRAAKTLDAALLALGRAPIAHIADRAVYGDLAEQGLGLYDRKIRSLDPLRAQWAPVLELIGA